MHRLSHALRRLWNRFLWEMFPGVAWRRSEERGRIEHYRRLNAETQVDRDRRERERIILETRLHDNYPGCGH